MNNSVSESNFSSNSSTNGFLNDPFSRMIPDQVSYITTIIINGITCPFTVLLNLLGIVAVKRRRSLQTKTNILLACLAATDALTGLVVQPSFVLWTTFRLIGRSDNHTVRDFHNSSLRSLAVCSSLHLMLVTCERLIAIKFTMQYPYVVIKRNIQVAVISIWIFTISCDLGRRIRTEAVTFFNGLVALILLACIIFILFSYAILYRETLRHQKKIKMQQLPQEEVERFLKERKALKTTVLVVVAVTLCFLPVPLGVLASTSLEKWYNLGLYKIILVSPYVRTFVMLNSFLNPLIYCWRQRKMREFVFRISP